MDAGLAVRIDSALDPAVAATLLCSGYVAYSGLVDAAVRPGDRVAVVGFGGIGHLATQYARAFGAEVTVLTTSADKESDARRLGAEHVVVADADQLGQPVPELGELDAALLTSEHPGALMTAVHALAPYGRLVAVAAPVEPVPLVLQRLLHYKLDGRRRLPGAPAPAGRDVRPAPAERSGERGAAVRAGRRGRGAGRGGHPTGPVPGRADPLIGARLRAGSRPRAGWRRRG